MTSRLSYSLSLSLFDAQTDLHLGGKPSQQRREREREREKREEEREREREREGERERERKRKRKKERERAIKPEFLTTIELLFSIIMFKPETNEKIIHNLSWPH
jgi:hypothetical protein